MKYYLIKSSNKKNYKIIIILNLVLQMIILTNYFKNNNSFKLKTSIKSIKWIIMIAFNPPNPSIINLLEMLENWKIVVISNNEKIDEKWESVDFSDKVIYLSLTNQINLGYKIMKFLNFNSSFARKNIGYLYAIQHGAKEIFEVDENIIISNIYDLNLNYKMDKICYGIRNDSSMINPYSHFKKNNINLWPRGFRLSDIGKDDKNKFYILNHTNLLLKPLIYQGIVNGFPDVDSIFLQTKIFNKFQKINFIYNYPLVYLPGNYIPINSKNTKYLYDIFPFLLLPTTVNERISDIWRGYIMQYFAWRFDGCVIYYKSKNYIKKYSLFSHHQFHKEKNLFFSIDKFLDVLNINSNLEFNNSIDLLYKIIKDLINNKLLGKNEIKIYKAFFEDLSNVGYYFPPKFFNKIVNKHRKYINAYSKFNFYLPSELISIINYKNKNSVKIINHYYSLKQFLNILLIINYNQKNYEKLNFYILNLYKNFFPNYVFITPNEINSTNNNTISCNETNYGYQSYICLEKVYRKYPDFKGYLFVNDDDFIKIWELDNLNYDIPWFYLFHTLLKEWGHYKRCKDIYKVLNKNNKWKLNLTKFLGYYNIPVVVSDFYYIPNNMISQFCQIVKEMYKSKLFLECVIPTTMGIILSKEYQLIHFKPLYRNERKKAINYLRKDFKQITIHPIKFSNEYNKIQVIKFIYFINAKEY